MEKHQFKTSIDASPERVWNILWSDDTYPLWTAVFSEGSRAESDWKEGSKILFVNAEGEGMVATIARKIPNKFMSFKHLGMVSKGVEKLEGEDVQEWAGALENYTLKEVGGKTELTVDIDLSEEWKDYFYKTWPKALDNLKDLAEQKN